MRSLWILVLVACLPFISAKPLEEESKPATAPLIPKAEQTQTPETRSYHLLSDDEADTSEEPESESESEIEPQPEPEMENEENEMEKLPEAEAEAAEPELADQTEEEEEEEEEEEDDAEANAEADKTPQVLADDDDDTTAVQGEESDQLNKMRGVVTSSLGYQYYIGQQILYQDNKGKYIKGRLIDFTSSGLRLRLTSGKMFNVLKNWKTTVIPLEVPSTCSFFRHLSVLIWKSNKYTLGRIESAYYNVRLDRGGTKGFPSKLLRPMRVRLCEASKTRDVRSPDVLVRDSATGGYWLTGRIERKSSGNKYVIRRYKDRQQVTMTNKDNNILVNKEPNMRTITVGSRVVANIGGVYRPGTVIQIKYNYIIKKTKKKGIETPENLVIVPKQPWYIAWRVRPGRGGGKGISTLVNRQQVIVIKNERGLTGRVTKEVTSRDGRKIVYIKVIVTRDRKKEFTKGIDIWVKVREIRYYAKVISVGPSTSYAIIKISTQGSARPSRLWKYIKKTLTALASKKKGNRFYGYHKCFNYFGTVLKNVPENNQRSTRTRMVDVLFKTVGSGGTRNVPGKNKGISVKMLGRYYEGMVVKKELMQFTARFRVSSTIKISILEKVDRLRNGFQRRISKLDKSGFVIWGRFSSRNFPSVKVVTYNPNQSGQYVSFKIIAGQLRRGSKFSAKFGSITSSATVIRTSGQYAYVKAYVPRGALRIAYGKEIDRIRNTVFQSVIRTRALSCGGGQVYGSGGLGDSYILRGKGQYISSINKWMKQSGQGNVEWSRCFSTKKDGWSSHNFHKKCDNKGPSVTIVQVGQNIFGGYASVAWRTNAGYIKSNKNFLFSLKNTMNKPPFKIPAKSSGNHAIYSNNGYGPTFGGGHDLYLVNGHGGSCYSNLGHSYVASGYRYGSSQIKKVLAGKYRFQATNYEVFIQKPKPGAGFLKSRVLGGKRSYIYRLSRWLAASGFGGGTWSNCYRATRDGWASSTFHRRCNNKGATVTLVKTSNGNIFGGFNQKAWSSRGSYQRSSSSFVFSLKNRAGLGPVKMWPKSTRLQYASYNNNGYGPTFGGGHDLYIANNAGSNMNSYSNLGHSYTPPKSFNYGASKTKNIFAGRYKFKPVEVEVYNV